MANKGQFKKGHEGRKPKGAVSKKTKAWEELGDFITSAGAIQAMEIINSYAEKDINGKAKDPEKFLQHYNNLLEYFKPKQSRVEGSFDKDTELVVRIIKE